MMGFQHAQIINATMIELAAFEQMVFNVADITNPNPNICTGVKRAMMGFTWPKSSTFDVV